MLTVPSTDSGGNERELGGMGRASRVVEARMSRKGVVHTGGSDLAGDWRLQSRALSRPLQASAALPSLHRVLPGACIPSL